MKQAKLIAVIIILAVVILFTILYIFLRPFICPTPICPPPVCPEPVCPKPVCPALNITCPQENSSCPTCYCSCPIPENTIWITLLISGLAAVGSIATYNGKNRLPTFVAFISFITILFIAHFVLNVSSFYVIGALTLIFSIVIIAIALRE